MTTTTTNESMAPLALIFAVNDGMMTRAVQGLSLDELWHRPSDRSNPMFWLLGHVVHTRGSALRLLGDSYTTGWGEIFRRGAVLATRDSYPTLEEIQRARDVIAPRLQARLAAATDDVLSGPAAVSPTPAIKTVGDLIAFLAFHDSYHVGQLAFLRKLLGHPSVAG